MLWFCYRYPKEFYKNHLDLSERVLDPPDRLLVLHIHTGEDKNKEFKFFQSIIEEKNYNDWVSLFHIM